MTDASYKRLIIAVSLLVPLLVTALVFVKIPVEGVNLLFFPKFHATLNSITSILLIVAFILIKRKNINAHKNVMLAAVGVSTLFLMSYVFYHSISEPTRFEGTGTIRYVYFFILLTHIVLAAGVLPFVLMTLYRGLTKKYVEHRKIAKWTFPVWLYVAITGVLVYLMMAPYY